MDLVDGNDRSGRVVITIDDANSTICDTTWTTYEANAVCRGLGYNYGTPVSGSYYGVGTGNSFIDNFACSYYSQTILNCRHSGVSTNNSRCSDHKHDAGVTCHRDGKCNQGSLYQVQFRNKSTLSGMMIWMATFSYDLFWQLFSRIAVGAPSIRSHSDLIDKLGICLLLL